jgi:Holliday junction resolvase RusA-like endonuclease
MGDHRLYPAFELHHHWKVLAMNVDALQITIKNFKCPSMNDVVRVHFIAYSKKMKMVKALVMGECLSQVPAKVRKEWQKARGIQVAITGRYKGSNRRDTDNLYIKPVLDGLVAAGILSDDNCDVVSKVVLVCERNSESDSLSLLLYKEHKEDDHVSPVPQS